jgi:oligopeptide/dipeptide ABC transporter ATP-binding protein
MHETQDILEVKNIRKTYNVSAGLIFSRKTGNIKAVDDLSFSVKRGETFGLVGESSCGKTTTGRIIAGLLPADSGQVIFDGMDFLKESSVNPSIRKRVQVIFQDPLSSLNPRMNVFDIVSEPLEVHNTVPRDKRKDEVVRILEEVNLNSTFLERFPHQLSGGQRQRVLTARALILSPDFIIADEPVSALDVSVQAQILNMFIELQKKKGFSSLFISHDLAVIRYICQRTGVMYMGKLIETGPSAELFDNPLHPYTQALKDSSPDIKKREISAIMKGNVPNPLNPPSGCVFHPRCPKATDICEKLAPEFKDIGNGRWVACHLV